MISCMMVHKLNYIDGSLHTAEQIKDILDELSVPTVFTKQIISWEASKWSMQEFTRLFGLVLAKFKIFKKVKRNKKRKIDSKEDDGQIAEKTALPVVMETDCSYVDASFKEFESWLNDAESKHCGELDTFSCATHWCYADYIYMVDLFKNHKYALQAVDWSKFGFPNRNGQQSTIWIGSDGSFTPCHQDSYGCNLVAQIDGVKRWYLFPPSLSEMMYPTRIPYEESSVFCTVNPKAEELQRHCYKVDLQPGEVLFVPKHWWHYVENITSSISINTWIEKADDDIDRVRESLVNLLVHSLKSSDGTPTNIWLNPKQEPSTAQSCLQLVYAAVSNSCNGKHEIQSLSKLFLDNNFLINCITNPEVLDTIIKIMKRHTEKLEVNDQSDEGGN